MKRLQKKWYRLLYALFDYRFVYLLKKGRLTKIGISTNVERRQREIKRSGTATKLITARRLFFAQRIETRLHRKYKQKRRRIKGSGGTEYFYLNLIEKLKLRCYLAVVCYLQRFFVLLLLTGIIIGLITIL